MGRDTSRPGSSKFDQWIKMKKNQFDRSEIWHSDVNTGYHDPFLRYWIKIYDLSGPVRDPTHPGYLAQVFVDTGANCNTISRALFEQLIDRGLVSELVKGPETGVRINLVGGQTLGISSDKAIIEVDVGIKTSIQEFLILEQVSEPLVMGVIVSRGKLWRFD